MSEQYERNVPEPEDRPDRRAEGEQGHHRNQEDESRTCQNGGSPREGVLLGRHEAVHGDKLCGAGSGHDFLQRVMHNSQLTFKAFAGTRQGQRGQRDPRLEATDAGEEGRGEGAQRV